MAATETTTKKLSDSSGLINRVNELADYFGKTMPAAQKARYVRRLSTRSPRSLQAAIERAYDECERFPTTGTLLAFADQAEERISGAKWKPEDIYLGDPNCPACNGSGWKHTETKLGNSAVVVCPCREGKREGYRFPAPKPDKLYSLADVMKKFHEIVTKKAMP